MQPFIDHSFGSEKRREMERISKKEERQMEIGHRQIVQGGNEGREERGAGGQRRQTGRAEESRVVYPARERRVQKCEEEEKNVNRRKKSKKEDR